MSACWRSDFRIKKKSDVTELFDGNAFSGEMYVSDGSNDYCFEKMNGKHGYLSYRSVTERGDIFSPYFCITDEKARSFVWANRKMFNEFLRR